MRYAILLLSLALSVAAQAASFREAVEADWLLQDRVRGATFKMGVQVSTREDAAGAVDGVKDGKWGFHTAQDDPKPWWQVDLGSKLPLDRVAVFNRCDGGCPSRNTDLTLLLSDNAKDWALAYKHNGQPFGGQPDGKPLVVPLGGKAAQFVRLQIPRPGILHLDEVEVFATSDPKKNIALGRPADQSSASMWSTVHSAPTPEAKYPIDEVLRRGRLLADDLRQAGAPIQELTRQLDALAERAKALPKDASAEARRALYLEARWTIRRIAFSNPLLSFDEVLFAKQVPSSFQHMSDQHYGWWSRPGGGLYILTGTRGEEPRLRPSTGSGRGEPAGPRCLTASFPPGSFLHPELSYDGRRILFAWCRYYAETSGNPNKVNKRSLPDDAFYHVFEMNADGTGLRQLTRGRYDDFDARYLPDGRIVFLSTRRGQELQCGRGSAQATVADPFLPDSYVRCGGDNGRPVAVYTLHTMNPDGSDLRCISGFENFEWTPSVSRDGRILYARWDYVDRNNMPFMSLWSVHPDGTNPALVYGNFTRNPHCIFEARSIPNSDRLIFTASAHHAITAGSLCLLDPRRGTEETPPLTRLTPEVCFPETDGWPATYYTAPYPLSERYFLVAWSPQPIIPQAQSNAACTGLYLYDAFGNLELIHRDPEIASTCPIPFRPRPVPHRLPEFAGDDRANPEGRFLLLNVYRGLTGIAPGTIRWLRIIAVPAKTQPHMNTPNLGVTADDPGKCVLGIVPVEPDGSAYFRVPAGVIVFFQALDERGMAVQTMRTVTSVQPGQTLSCVGCHEQRQETPPVASALSLSPPAPSSSVPQHPTPNTQHPSSPSVPEHRQPNTEHPSSSSARPFLAAARPPSPITPGPEGSWPFRYEVLVQPVLDRHCVRCHNPQGDAKAVAKLNLTPGQSYAALLNYGSPSLRSHVGGRYGEGRSVVGQGAALTSPVLAHLRKGHQRVQLDPDAWDRLITWIDTYGQRQGSFSPEQEQRLRDLRQRLAPLFVQR